MMRLPADALRGSYPPLVTPFAADGSVDLDAYASLIERQIAGGSHGITVNGTTAEPSTLTVDERNRIVSLAVEVVAGRVPVVAATGSQSHAETVALTEHAARAGADAVLIVTPYYIRPPARGLVAYFSDLGARCELPLLVYHIPGRTAVEVPPPVLEQIAEATPTFVGLKHAVNDLGYVTEARRRLGDDLRTFVGLEELSLPMLAVGATGLMNAVGNVAPSAIASLYESVASGDLATARKQHDALLELNQAVFWDTNPIPIKYLMRRLGVLPTNEHRLPMMPATPELEARLDALLDRVGTLS
jgi:4-hydroxy-tetrahydrodipicolinate synthase